MEPKIEKRFENTSKSKTFQNIVRTFDLDKKRVLDIGCSFGEFVARFGEESTGITITQDEVTYGKKKGLDIRYGNIESDDFVLEEKYDAIFSPKEIFEDRMCKFFCPQKYRASLLCCARSYKSARKDRARKDTPAPFQRRRIGQDSRE